MTSDGERIYNVFPTTLQMTVGQRKVVKFGFDSLIIKNPSVFNQILLIFYVEKCTNFMQTVVMTFPPQFFRNLILYSTLPVQKW